MQLLQPCDRLLQRDAGRQVEDQWTDLRPQEVVGAGGAERGEPRVLGASQEVQYDIGVGEVAYLRAVGGGQTTDDGAERGGAGPALVLGRRPVPVEYRPERFRLAALGEECLRGADDVQGVALALLGGRAPGGDAVAAENAADGLGVGSLDGRDVQAELEAGSAPRHPHDLVAEALLGQRLAVGGAGERDAGVGVEMVDVGGLDEAVHRGVDGRRGAPLPCMQ